MGTRVYCPDCAHEAHPAGRCQMCWSDGLITARRPERCTASLDAQSSCEEGRLRNVVHDRPDDGDTSPDWWKRVMAMQSKSGPVDDEDGGL